MHCILASKGLHMQSVSLSFQLWQLPMQNALLEYSDATHIENFLQYTLQ